VNNISDGTSEIVLLQMKELINENAIKYNKLPT